MRRKDREMDERFALYVVDKCAFASLSMVTEKGEPYCVPITIARVDNMVYFHSATEGTKTDVLRTNPAVCLVCVGDTHVVQKEFTVEYESAVIFGKAFEVHDDAEKISALRAICERHTPDNMANFDSAVSRSLPRTAIWRIEIESITGKRKKYDLQGKEMKFGRME